MTIFRKPAVTNPLRNRPTSGKMSPPRGSAPRAHAINMLVIKTGKPTTSREVPYISTIGRGPISEDDVGGEL